MSFSSYPLFTAFALFVCILVHFLIWRRSARLALPVAAWVLTIIALSCGWFLAENAGKKEAKRLQEMVMGYAPTYAIEMERMGHHNLATDASPDDPLYLEMINAQIRWLKANPSVNDIYTIRKTETSRAFIVDSETDYDRNGVIEGDTESRTDLGEVYDEEDEDLDTALSKGVQVFNPEPVVDRWGTWVSTYTPIFAPDGSVDAILGIDFDAREWIAAIARAKGQVMALVALSLLLLYGAVSFATVLMQRQAKEFKEHADQKFETLVNSIQGVVFEWSPKRKTYDFVSAQAQAVTGVCAEQWLAGNWHNEVHIDDIGWLVEKRKQVTPGESYDVEFRMRNKEGKIRWIRETGVAASEQSETVIRGVLTDITAEKKADSEMEALNKQLIETSRQAGMAEIASGVLHNIGNVLNSVNVAGEVIKSRLDKSRLPNLRRLAQMLKEQDPGQLPDFFASEKGRMVPDYLDKLTEELANEQVDFGDELKGLAKNVEHIKDIVMMQQAYAKISGRIERVDLRELVEDSLKINAGSFSNHNVKVKKNFIDSADVLVDRHKLLQILINLVRNAKHALDRDDIIDRVLTATIDTNSAGNVQITISDNGVGIEKENFDRLFSHGFTTKKTGHGFGLHISAVAIKEMGGELTAHSDGAGKGASFTVTLPACSSDTSERARVTTGDDASILVS